MSTQPHPGLSGLDRKAMEAERLARLAKKRGAPEEPAQVSAAPMKKQKQTVDAAEESLQRPLSPPAIKRPNKINAKLQYPYGTIKRTWVFGYDRQGDDIKMEEVLQRSSLRVAVLSSWQIDFDWITSKLDLPRTKCVMVGQEKDPAQQDKLHTDAQAGGVFRFCFPPMRNTKQGVMHSKLMLLFHEDYLRIVVPSANLVPHDWGEKGGVMENVVFLIDLPRLSQDQQSGNDTHTSFATELIRFLTISGIDKSAKNESQLVLEAISKFDFSNTKHLAFVHSIGTAAGHEGEEAFKTGHALLAQSVNELGLSTKEPLDIDYASTSMGSLDINQVQQLHNALQGVRPSPNNEVSVPPSTEQHMPVRIVFPTDHYVQHSKGGPDSAGTIFCLYSMWNSGKFPQQCMFKYESRRPGCLSHSKMMVVTSPSHKFVYCGSHNFSQAAWGKLSLSGRGKNKIPKMQCSNWECGVLMVTAIEGGDDESNSSQATIDQEALEEAVKHVSVAVPFKQPTEPYGTGDKPWIQSFGGSS